MAMGRRQAGILLVLLGLGTLVWSALQGDLRVGLFLVIPYAYGTGLLPFLGFVLLMVGAFLWMTAGFERVRGWEGQEDAYASRAEPRRPVWDAAPPPRGDLGGSGAAPRAQRRVKHGGFVMLGPIPIVWGNDKRMLPWLILLGLGLMALMVFLPLLLR